MMLEARTTIPLALAPSSEFLSTLSLEQQLDCWRACLLVYSASGQKIVPRDFQLKAAMPCLRGVDSVVVAGTGTGKTLIAAIPLLLLPKTISIMISPLKRLQSSHVKSYAKLGDVESGKYPLLIVSPEQLGMLDGHLPRLALLLNKPRFVANIKRVHVDEAHTIYTAGISKHGEPAFRPAWGTLDVLRILLQRGTPFQLLSATLPDHILRISKEKTMISPDCFEARMSTNRPNITYATLELRDGAHNLSNLDFLIPTDYTESMGPLSKTVVFHDSKPECSNACIHLNDLLPPELRDTGVIMHYHSGMSRVYLDPLFADFASPTGRCRILCATSCASTGLDVPGIEKVIQYGVTTNGTDSIQRAGRGGRDDETCALFLMMIEPWAYKAELDGDDLNDDPDKPHRPKPKDGNRTKQDRIGRASLAYAQTDGCLRQFWATYLNDNSSTALDYTNKWCCDRHPGNEFDLQSFFKAPLRKEITETGLRAVRPASFILDNPSIQLLAKMTHESIRSISDIVTALHETPSWETEWGAAVFRVVSTYSQGIEDKKNEIIRDFEMEKAAAKASENRRKAALKETEQLEKEARRMVAERERAEKKATAERERAEKKAVAEQERAEKKAASERAKEEKKAEAERSRARKAEEAQRAKAEKKANTARAKGEAARAATANATGQAVVLPPRPVPRRSKRKLEGKENDDPGDSLQGDGAVEPGAKRIKLVI
ncbi:hypothetical protein PLICRDRAFT_26163 [Plicaturopsis crispa FD-325 SS-3]|nr:hypothetical protein PLICRDRAFT_26163 [Plicaturopsis crispa FD-325 SS-3]